MTNQETSASAEPGAGHPTISKTGIAESLHPELDRRLAAIESGAEAGSDFDAVSWVWMLLLGVVLPLVLLIWGWVG